jgi:hypothetical protein
MNEPTPLVDRLMGRIDYLLNIGRVKDPELMQDSLEALSELMDATQQLLIYLEAPEDGAQSSLMDRCHRVLTKINGEQA